MAGTRDDPVPLASIAIDLMERAAKKGAPDPELAAILAELEAVLPILRMDEPRSIEWARYTPPKEKLAGAARRAR